MIDRSFRLVVSASADYRLGAARQFLRACPPAQPITLIASERGAADDLARSLAAERSATFGLTRLSLTQLAASTALACARRGWRRARNVARCRGGGHAGHLRRRTRRGAPLLRAGGGHPRLSPRTRAHPPGDPSLRQSGGDRLARLPLAGADLTRFSTGSRRSIPPRPPPIERRSSRRPPRCSKRVRSRDTSSCSTCRWPTEPRSGWSPPSSAVRATCWRRHRRAIKAAIDLLRAVGATVDRHDDER